MASPIETFPPEVRRLLDLVEGNLHYIVKIEMTREQAIEIKRRMCLPLGALSSKHEMRISRPTNEKRVDNNSR